MLGKLLVVDYVVVNWIMMKVCFVGVFYDVLQVCDFDEVWQYLNGDCFDMVLIDFKMFDEDFLCFCCVFCVLFKMVYLLVFLFSGKDDCGYCICVLKVGVDDVLVCLVENGILLLCLCSLMWCNEFNDDVILFKDMVQVLGFVDVQIEFQVCVLVLIVM